MKKLSTPYATKKQIHEAARSILGIQAYSKIMHLSKATIWLLCKEYKVDKESYNKRRMEYIKQKYN